MTGRCRPGRVSRTISRTPLTMDLTVVCMTSAVVPPPGASSDTVVPPATVANDEIDVVKGVPVVTAPAPVVEQPSSLVREGIHVVEPLQPLLPLSGRPSSSSSPTLPWGVAEDSSPPFSPNCVQAGCSQDVPDEDSLFNVSLLSPGLLFRPFRGGQSPPAEGVLLPTTLDDFDDSVQGDPITYARCEHFPGSESPVSLPVYAWPFGSTFLLDPTVFQTVLASGTSTSAAAPPIDLGDGRLLETGLPGCPYRFAESGGLPFSNENPAYGLQIHHPRVSGIRRSTGVCPTPRLFADVLGGSVGQGTSDGSGHQPTAGCGRHVVKSSDTITVRDDVTQNVLLDDGLGHWTVLVSGSRSRRLVAGAASSSGCIVYMSAMGLWRPQTGSGDPGPVPVLSCRSCMNCKYCFPKDQLPPG